MKYATAVNIAIKGIAVLLRCRKTLVEAIEFFNNEIKILVVLYYYIY